MRAVVLSEVGTPDKLTLMDVEAPLPREHEVTIAVTAAALNYSDLLQRQGIYSKAAALPTILGIECSGTITQMGSKVTGWQVGDPVCALVTGGAYAERVVAPASQLMPVPAGIDLVAAAAMPEAACTIWSNLIDICSMKAGDTVLVHGGAGGIGSFAIQVASAIGATVFATAGDATKLARCVAMGAERAISYRDDDFVKVLQAETGNRGADVILDNMGASYLQRNLAALAMDGRIAMIGLQGGTDVRFSLREMFAKRASLITTSLRDRTAAEKQRIVSGACRDLWPLLERGQVVPVIDRTFPLTDARAAHQYMETAQHVGKILLVT
ncbi:NAD(P)H-quinone oxidoreductase [Microvirga brassicacearum]|uniref:NAD(P)H-quinone oxidoreductase n=1 Tax=Microvirga brassicacearum TaxID=2580413 RepID=A0A5N3PEA7_9HYPH|nr:NAD(P)H-quinone oxidoreductase [Microvirga brassicacearum]KAB0268044.1 NAD(P)H-quinone oxidoreductase [Microvirga brassicacearum]